MDEILYTTTEMLMDEFEKLKIRNKELEDELHKAACDISFWREQHADSCKKVIELESQLNVGDGGDG